MVIRLTCCLHLDSSFSTEWTPWIPVRQQALTSRPPVPRRRQEEGSTTRLEGVVL